VADWITKVLVEYTAQTKFEHFPANVIERAKVLLMDHIGCALGGCKSPIGNSVIKPFSAMGGAPEATIIGGGVKVPCIQAAFVNGTNANAIDFDDTYLSHGIGHPGSTIMSAALAAGEWKGISGAEILTAIITGYEVGNRIGLAIQPTYQRLQEVWGVGTWQTFGAVVAASKAMKLSEDQIFNAFGIAGATAPLPNTQKWGWDISERPIHWVKEPTGWPSWTGTLAAILAENGFIGNRYILDGKNGFWIMAGSDQCDYEKMTAGLGNEYIVVNNMAIKPYSCCRWMHPALDCIKLIKQNNNMSYQDVDEIVINSFCWLKSQEVYEPVSVVDAQFCIPYTATMVMMGHQTGPNWYTEAKLKDPEITAFSKRVKVNLDQALDRLYSEENELSARVEIRTTQGKIYHEEVRIPSGDPRNPLTAKEIENKFLNQATNVLSEQNAKKVVEIIANIEKAPDISELMSIIKG